MTQDEIVNKFHYDHESGLFTHRRGFKKARQRGGLEIPAML